MSSTNGAGNNGTATAKSKVPAPPRDLESAPLLVYDDRSEDGTESAGADEDPSWTQQLVWFFQNLGAWFLENVVIVVLACLLIAGTATVVIYGLTHRDSGPKPAIPTCTTPGCVLASAELIRSMSPNYKNIDPCDDFRTYVCEGFDSSHDWRDDQSDVFTGTIMAENGQAVLRHILESEFSEEFKTLTASVDEENFNKIQDGYVACMDQAKIKEQRAKPLLDLVLKVEDLFPIESKSKQGLFPLFSNTNGQGLLFKGENKLSKTLSYLMSIGISALVSLDVRADDKLPEQTSIFIGAPYRIGLPSKAYYNDTKLLELYKSTIMKVHDGLIKQLPKGSRSLEHMRDEYNDGIDVNEDAIEALISFEKKLAEASPDPEEAQDVTFYYNLLSLAETKALIPSVSLQYLIDQRASGFVPENLIVESPAYLKALSKILSDTPKRTIRGYLLWKVIQSYGPYLEDDSIKPLLQLNNELRGKEPDSKPERWRTCAGHIDEGLGWILSRFFIERAFSKESKDFGDQIVSDIKDRFIAKLNALDWMSKDVRKFGVEKVHNIEQKIGYPTKSPNIRDPEELKSYYGNVNISSSTYFQNALSMTESEVNKGWSQAGKPTNKDEWGMTASTVNAYYNPPGNEIVFPAGIMQSPVFYDPSIPQYLSYGAFGSVAGHELSHAFDSLGRHYDQNGAFKDWWDNSTVKAFEEKASCFVNEYANYTVPDRDGKPLHINGLLTLGENIADAGGVTASFQAWKRRDEEKPDKLLPGLEDHTKEQLFFVSYANWWCGKTRPAEAVNRVYTDPHSPFFVRILATMANSREFRESFSCPIKEPTCELW